MTIEALATKLGPLDEMRSSPAARRFTLAVWRAFRDTGAPLDQAALDALATTASLDPSDAKVLIERYAELDNDGDVIGLSGLSVGDHLQALRVPVVAKPSWLSLAEDILSLW